MLTVRERSRPSHSRQILDLTTHIQRLITPFDQATMERPNQTRKWPVYAIHCSSSNPVQSFFRDVPTLAHTQMRAPPHIQARLGAWVRLWGHAPRPQRSASLNIQGFAINLSSFPVDTHSPKLVVNQKVAVSTIHRGDFLSFRSTFRLNLRIKLISENMSNLSHSLRDA